MHYSHSSVVQPILLYLLQGGGGLLGMSADGAHAPYIPAGADTESMRKASGTAKNAKNHLFQEDTTVPWWKTPGSASHKGEIALSARLLSLSLSFTA